MNYLFINIRDTVCYGIREKNVGVWDEVQKGNNSLARSVKS